MDEIKKLDLESMDLVADRLHQLRRLMPEAFEEGGIDFDKLRLLLGDEVDEGDERYAFTWPGKADAIRQSQASTTATLRPVVEKSRGRGGEDGSFDSDNIYIEGDNLEALKLLQRAYHGKVKLIYIDPPYNTGHDFVYKDKFGDTIENYKEQTGQTNQSNPETSGRYHSDWCSMMYPRLKLARELLSDDGSIFISIDDNELVNLETMANELFGDLNNVATIVVTVKPEGRRYGAFAKTHEYIVVFAKDAAVAEFNEIPAEGASFAYNDKHGGFNLQGLRNRNVRAFNSSNRPNLHYPFYVDPRSRTQDGLFSVSVVPQHDWIKVWPAVMDGLESVWRWGKDKASSEIEDLTATLGNDGSYRIFQKVRSLTQIPKTTWTNKYYQSNRGTKEVAQLLGPGVFDFPKPTDLIKQVVRIGSSNQSLVMDFFSGSGTFAEAVTSVNEETNGSRRWISIQLPESCGPDSAAVQAGYQTLCDIGEERIRRAGNKIAEEVTEANKQPKIGEEPKPLPDIGFRVFELDESGIAEPENGQLLVDRRKDGRSDLDIIFEVMLKWGYELTYPIEKVEFAGYGCYSVAAGDLICCMEPGLTVDALEAIADEQPRRVFIMDSVFGHDDSLKLDALAIFKHAEEKTQQKIELRTV